MVSIHTAPSPAFFLARADLGRLIDLLREDGRTVIGPTVRDNAIVYDEIRGVGDLPAGYGDRQTPGRYSLTERSHQRLFDYNVGPSSWKRYTYPPRVPIGLARKDGSAVSFGPPETEVKPVAFLGVRACELAALGIQDRVFLGGAYQEEDYRARRQAAIVVAVQCTTASSNCFCTSMETGPEVRGGHDLALTELDSGFVLEAGSPVGRELLERLPVTAATIEQAVGAAQQVAAVRTQMGEPLPMAGLHDRLLAKLDSPRWAEIADRCLACANCTLVCPTCFCTSVERVGDLDGQLAESVRVWDSCFAPGFAKVAGGNFRSRVQDRYRQWLTHKFANWWDQFGSAGCVGCGRCITWCPVGIDIREELMAIAPANPTPPLPAQVEPVPVVSADFVTTTVAEKRQETPDTWSLTLRGLDADHAAGRPGQFVMLALPAFPPSAICISRVLPPDGIVCTIRAAGPATTAITSLNVGDQIGVRGPLGVGWPIDVSKGRDIVVVTGGSGLAPLRGLIDTILADRASYGEFHLYYGARTADDMLYKDELAVWNERPDVDLTCRWLQQATGVVASSGAARGTVASIHAANWEGRNAIAFVAGPDRMMEATATALLGKGITNDRVFVTTERHMECGIGLCGHCQMGRFFVCKDGPVFQLAQLGDTFGREGI